MRSRVRTSTKRVLAAVSTNNQDDAVAALTEFSKLIDTAAGKGIYHPNTAARKKSRLAKKVNGIQS